MDEILLGIIDCYSNVTFTICTEFKYYSNRSHNMVQITGEYVEVNKEIEENIKKNEMKTSCCFVDCNMIEKGVLEQLMQNNVYDVFTLFNCDNDVNTIKYEKQFEEGGTVCLRRKGAC